MPQKSCTETWRETSAAFSTSPYAPRSIPTASPPPARWSSKRRRSLAEDAPPEPAGIHYNAEGRTWNWGNAVVGVRNAIAPPVVLHWENNKTVTSEVDLGVA